jgi:uncharacterized membrane protein
MGVPNYFSMFFLLKTLEVYQGSFIFPVNNIAIVASTALAARLFYAEHLNRQMMIGLGLAILSICLIGFS